MTLDRLMLFSNKFASDIENWQKSRNRFWEYSIFHSLSVVFVATIYLDRLSGPTFLELLFVSQLLHRCVWILCQQFPNQLSGLHQQLIGRCHCDMPRKQLSCQNILFTWTSRKQISAIFDGVIEPPPRSKCVVTPLFGCGVVFLSTVPRENINT